MSQYEVKRSCSPLQNKKNGRYSLSLLLVTSVGACTRLGPSCSGSWVSDPQGVKHRYSERLLPVEADRHPGARGKWPGVWGPYGSDSILSRLSLSADSGDIPSCWCCLFQPISRALFLNIPIMSMGYPLSFQHIVFPT